MFLLLFWIWFAIHNLQLAYQQNRGKEVKNIIRYESLSYILIVINPFMLYIWRNFLTWSGLKQSLSCPLVRLPFPLNYTSIRTRRYKFLLIAHYTYFVNTKITSLLHYPEKKIKNKKKGWTFVVFSLHFAAFVKKASINSDVVMIS